MTDFSSRDATAAAAPDIASGARAAVSGASRAAAGFRAITRWTIFLVCLAIPVLALPFTEDPRFPKTLLIEAAALIAGAAWIFRTVPERRAKWLRNPMHMGFLMVAVALVIAHIGSVNPGTSMWGNDPTAEKTATLLSLFILAFAGAATFDRRDVRRASVFLLVGGVLAALWTILLFAAAQWIALPSWLAINPVGTPSQLAGVIGVLFAFALALTLSRRTAAGRTVLSTRLWGIAAAATAFLTLAALIIGFREEFTEDAAVLAGMVPLWAPLGIAMLGATGAAVLGMRGREALWGQLRLIAVGVVALFALLFTFQSFSLPSEPGGFFARPVEITPSWASTFAIARETIMAKPFGYGPDQFMAAYNQYRDPVINNSVFWNLRFDHGVAWLPTIAVTLGVPGLVAFGALIILMLVLLVRGIRTAAEADPLRVAFAGMIVAALALLFVGGSTITSMALLFLALGCFTAIIREPAPAEGVARSWWRVTDRTLLWDGSFLHMVAPLASVFVAAVVLAGGYLLATQYAGEIYFRRAAFVLQQFGNLDSAKIFLERAARLNPQEATYYQGRAQVGLGVFRQLLLAVPNPPTDAYRVALQTEYQSAIEAGRRATAMDSHNAQNWMVLGALYEAAIPFSEAGADTAAIDAYARAAAEDPTNPDPYLAQARVWVATADLYSLAIGQTVDGEMRGRLETARMQALAKAAEILETKAIALKQNYAPAHFLAAQTALRADNLQGAILASENTIRSLQPGSTDIGLLFQLGVLYYRADRMADAKLVLAQALLLDEQYSNARYFLGLVEEQLGDRDAAISQFEKIQKLNPDNAEVQQIIDNLRAGRTALDGIVPPNPAPEDRTDPPISENAAPGGRLPR